MKFEKGDRVKLKGGDQSGTVIALGKKGYRSQVNIYHVKWDSGKSGLYPEHELERG